MRGTPLCESSVVTCECSYHVTLRLTVMRRYLEPERAVVFKDRDGKEAGRIDP